MVSKMFKWESCYKKGYEPPSDSARYQACKRTVYTDCGISFPVHPPAAYFGVVSVMGLDIW